jgi:cytochrome c biogenesis protein ResB
LKKLLSILISPKLALLLGIFLMFFVLAGAVLPQDGMSDPDLARTWHAEHPLVGEIADALGLFHVFRSWPFLALIMALAVSTVLCTSARFLGNKGVRLTAAAWGSLLLHIALIVLMAGGFVSAAARFDGLVILTEGQRFTGDRDSFLYYTEGPLRKDGHGEVLIMLGNVRTEIEGGSHLVGVTSTLLADNSKEGHEVSVNSPWRHGRFTYTQVKTGFSPKLIISRDPDKQVLFDSFVALKTSEEGAVREYRDVLPLPSDHEQIVVTLLPNAEKAPDGSFVRVNDVLQDPVLQMDWHDGEARPSASAYLRIGESSQIAGLSFEFAGLRRWSSFRVVDDPGYPVILVSLWLGLLALLVRYVPETAKWLKE